ncbi:MAG: hypothetical protein KKG59_04430 [Nanoarchaeota archaeon]|nr:hypothetical protein [Nanoarchaeota archaeon]
MKVLVTAKWRAFTNALAPVARELIDRSHDVEIIATGNEHEAKGFEGLDYEHTTSIGSLVPLLKDKDLLITGLSGQYLPDAQFIRAINAMRKPSIGIMDQNGYYSERINQGALPTVIGLVSQMSVPRFLQELGQQGKDLMHRLVVVGWPGLDHYAGIPASFPEEEREQLRESLGIEGKCHLHLTQNIHPDTDYMRDVDRPYHVKLQNFLDEMNLTTNVLETAKNMGLRVVVKPYPGEGSTLNYTEGIALRLGHLYVPAHACNTQKLMLASHSISAGKSHALNEGCLLDINTVGFLPGCSQEDLDSLPAISNNAIPYTTKGADIPDLLEHITSQDLQTREELQSKRRNFLVDGQGAKRVADYAERLTS